MNNTKGLSYYYERDAMESFYYDFLEKVEKNKATYTKLEGCYTDPDCVDDVRRTAFYNHLTYFLNHQEKKNKNIYSFLPPSEAPLTTPEEKDNECIDEKKITVIQNGKPLFRLSSDQFGFSARESIYSDIRYPLPRLLRLGQNRELKKQCDVKKIIAQYVINTRTIGGSFLWPVPPKGEGTTRVCQYNNNRGVNTYIEDRVDLTLLEIKHALDGSYDKGEHTSDILCKQYREEKTYIKAWLKHFDSFKEYVEYFMLEPFAVKVVREDGKEDFIPINIINGKPLDDDYIKNYKKKDKIQNLESPAIICGMLKRLESMILKRSENMENVIEQYMRKTTDE